MQRIKNPPLAAGLETNRGVDRSGFREEDENFGEIEDEETFDGGKSSIITQATTVNVEESTKSGSKSYAIGGSFVSGVGKQNNLYIIL